MTRDIVQENLESYLGVEAVREWTAETTLFPVEKDLIARHLPPPPARILDLGCGGGRTTVALETRGYDVDAIDLSEDLVREARKRVQRSRVLVMDARSLAFESGSFDAALFSFNGLDCVHPRSERQRVLREIHRVLRPSGTFYYSGHNGVGAWFPRPGDSARKLLRRAREMLAAQRRSRFSERSKYLAYPGVGGVQVLYSALPHTHRRDLEETGFLLRAVYGSRSYRKGPHVLDEPSASLFASVVRTGRIALTCPHLHYVAVRLQS